MVLGNAFGIAKDLVHQTALKLSKFGGENFILGMTRMGLMRESIPVNLGMVLGFLSPVLGIFAYHMIGRSELPIMDQENVLVRTHVRSLLIIAPVLLIAGVTTFLITAYFESPYKNINDLINFVDYVLSFSKSLAFWVTLSGLVFYEIKLLYKSTTFVKQIAVCILSILLNHAAIISVDVGITCLIMKL